MKPLLPLAGADDCGSCGAVHGRLDEFWACPTHGHRLQSHGHDGDMERFKCPAHRCAYERSAPPKPRTPSKGDPMTTVDTRPSVAVDKMWARSKHIAAVLPDHIDVKSFIGTAAAALYADASLMRAAETSPETLVAALMECASLGHRPGTDEYYLTPRKKGGKPTVLGIEGYRGIIERMYRSGAVAKVVVREVCAKDYFKYVEGIDARPVHNFGQVNTTSTGAGFFGEHGAQDRGEMVGVYAYAELTNGAVSRVVLLSKGDVMAAKESSDGSDSEYSPWNRYDGGKDRPEFKGRSMWWKTAARRLEPWVPTSAEYRREQLRATAQAAYTATVDPRDGSAPVPVTTRQAAELAAGGIESQAIENGSTESLHAAIRAQFDRLGLDDTEERTVYVCQIAGRDTLAELAPHDLRGVLAKLAECNDTADLHALTQPADVAS